jgi:putative drug exporter of the RND superfamily
VARVGRPSIFVAVGRFSVRYRWLVVITWVLLAAGALAFLPSLGSVVKNDNAAFLPTSAPSVRAQALVTPFQGTGQASGVLVASDENGPLSGADQSAVDVIAHLARGVADVTSVTQGPVSADGAARTLGIDFSGSVAGGGPGAARAVGTLRSIAADHAPPGLQVYVTGSLPELVDQQQAGNRTVNRVQIFSILLIVLLLLLAFRATLAPLATLAPAALALAVAGPVIAASTALGVEISSLLQLLLTALVLGAGTDYGLFLIFRYRENLRRGLSPHEAIVASVEKVGQSVTFSAVTVMAALLTLLLASFGLYRGVGPGLAIGIAVVLAVELTFFPALLAILGRAVFWPSVPRPGHVRPGRWGAIAARVSSRPVPAIVVGTLLLGALAGGLVAYAPSGFNPGGAIAGSNSEEGLQALETHFGPSALGVTDVVLRFPRPIWGRLHTLRTVERDLRASGRFSSVDDALDAGGQPVPPAALARAHRLLGPPQDLPAQEPSGDSLPPPLYDAYRAAAQYVSQDGRTVLYKTSLEAGGPGSTSAMQAIPGIRTIVRQVATVVGAQQYGVAGQAAAAADVSSYSGRDVARIAPLVLLILALILGLVLRSAVAPLYLVASVALSYLASLGLAVILFVVVGGQLGINFTLPFFLFVFVMALGEDYNILVMNRIREEAARLPLRRAVAVALGTTGTTVTSAGLVLAGTFGVLAAFTSGQVQQIATGLALGILLDTFIVRTLMVPSVAVLLGPWNWWPSKLGRRPAPGSIAVVDRGSQPTASSVKGEPGTPGTGAHHAPSSAGDEDQCTLGRSEPDARRPAHTR